MGEEKFYYSDLFKKIANEQKVLLNKGISEHDITYVQSLVILYLLNIRLHFGTDHEVSQRDIEHYLSLKGSTVTNILNRMEENEFILRAKSKKDSRANHLYLTEKGAAITPLFFGVLDHVEDLMTKDLNTDEKAQLQHLLQKVLMNLEGNKEKGEM